MKLAALWHLVRSPIAKARRVEGSELVGVLSVSVGPVVVRCRSLKGRCPVRVRGPLQAARCRRGPLFREIAARRLLKVDHRVLS